MIVENNNQKIPIEYVGTGISQLIPILFESMNGKNLLIKQPELHLHPKIQYALGQHIAKSINTNQCFIETHSQYIVDSIRHYARNNDEFAKSIKIIFFSNEMNNRKLEYIDIDAKGNMKGEGLRLYNKFFYDFLMYDLINEGDLEEKLKKVDENMQGENDK